MITFCVILGACKGTSKTSTGTEGGETQPPPSTPKPKKSKKEQEIERLLKDAACKLKTLRRCVEIRGKDRRSRDTAARQSEGAEREFKNKLSQGIVPTEEVKREEEKRKKEAADYISDMDVEIEKDKQDILKLQQELRKLEQELLDKGVDRDKVIASTRLTNKELDALKKELETP